ncbi:BRCA1-associated ATM activator 1 isoform X2 [Brienomyrus brachyistius]|uniref:BRCA1-associated ATM activator 1 isoform X2 n=1 Tax=Brienomyrus brachyistius TaxID=42636 RepID=UPI0020B45069|nr:BRCA1-associated ATM activator 1 isoform X2 [Brienomyrus brachyistius]XP_048870310.1 BRCA1-associated ATM activator 1 isoform X2 [Brienomyrus brachyistius]
MDSDCTELLPQVCAVLADPNRAIADDTCLEKLLDWLADLTVPGISLLELNPCLTAFLSDVCRSGSAEPSVFAFSLKLAGLLASSEQGFIHLQQQGILTCAFGYQEWAGSSLWQDATVRSGWIHGLWNMLQHWKAMHFLFENGFIKVILHLQLDRSLFVASAANRLLAGILSFPGLSDRLPLTGEGTTIDQRGERKDCDLPVYTDGIMEIVQHVEDSLTSGNPMHIQRSLNLIASSLAKCPAHVRDTFWQGTVGTLEALKGNDGNSLIQPFLETLHVASRTPLLSSGNPSIATLMEDMLCTLNPKVAITFAKGVIHMESCPQSLKKKALAVILQPLGQVGMLADPKQEPSGLLKDCDFPHAAWEEDFSQKSSYVSVLCLSLTSAAELLLEFPCEEDCVCSVLLSVIAVLKVCEGSSFSSSAGRAVRKLIGCTRVQKCALDTLSSLNKCSGVNPHVGELFSVLLSYLENPDSDPTAFKKALQAAFNWLCTCSQSSAAGSFLTQDLLPLLKKRFCDVRWEIRDSSLEFFTQLTLQFKDDASYRGSLSNSGIIDSLMVLLTDPESYVRASAISALGQIAHIIRQEEDLSARFLDILAQDTEGFARRAVIKIFSIWLKHPNQDLCKSLEKHLSTVLQLGSNDLDWEVKIHTLELAQILIHQTLEGSGQFSCPYVSVIPAPHVKRAEMTAAFHNLHHHKLFDVLFSGLLDCDRPVARKACTILLNLKGVLTVNMDTLDNTVAFNLQGCRWGQEMLKQCFNAASDSAMHVNIVELLSTLDLEDMKQALDQRSDHLENSPRSLLQDILASSHTSEDNIVDCY